VASAQSAGFQSGYCVRRGHPEIIVGVDCYLNTAACVTFYERCHPCRSGYAERVAQAYSVDAAVYRFHDYVIKEAW